MYADVLAVLKRDQHRLIQLETVEKLVRDTCTDDDTRAQGHRGK